LKETIEILFGEGLLKALFATETFAMGLNMPATTVVFTSSRKFDGKNFREITSGEYIQMSGRAGRRGLDDKGLVILMVDEKVSPAIGREIVQGKPNSINSAFHLTYNMVLNLLRVEEINPEYMLERSFFQFQNQSSIPDLYKKVLDKQTKLEKFHLDEEASIASYHHIREQLDNLRRTFHDFYTNPQYLVPFLHVGRLVKVKTNTDEFDWGVIIEFKKDTKENFKNPLKSVTKVIVHILLHVDEDFVKDGVPKPCPKGKKGSVQIIPVVANFIEKLSSLRVYVPNDLRSSDNRRSVLNQIEKVMKTYPDGPTLLNPIDDMKIKDKEFLNCVASLEKYEKRLFAHPLHDTPELAGKYSFPLFPYCLNNVDSFNFIFSFPTVIYTKYLEKLALEKEVKNAKQSLRMAKSLLQMDDLKQRKRVLRRLGYCNMSDVIEFKGRVACELSSGDELLLTEMIFNGTFNDLSVPQCVALLSCFVCDERSSEEPTAMEEMSAPLKQMQNFARRIAKVCIECKLEIDEEEYVDKFKSTLMDVVLAWCKGATFSQICKMTNVFEGSIIRCMRRLEELLRQMVQASKTIGNADLENKFSEGIRLLKRDIVFAASLYL
jgi:ATP-dependent RNA helicase DOB1